MRRSRRFMSGTARVHPKPNGVTIDDRPQVACYLGFRQPEKLLKGEHHPEPPPFPDPVDQAARRGLAGTRAGWAQAAAMAAWRRARRPRWL
jgi:hypothetical protein